MLWAMSLGRGIFGLGMLLTVSVSLAAIEPLDDEPRNLPGRDALLAGAAAPIPQDPKATTWEDFFQAQAPWAERVLFTPFRQRARGAAWERAATAFVQEAYQTWQRDYRLPSEELLARGKKLQETGCLDPLPLYLQGHLTFRLTQNWRAAIETLSNALAQATVGDQPRALARFAAIEWAALRAKNVHQTAGLYQPALELTKLALADGSYRPEEAPLFVQHAVAGPWAVLLDEDPEGLNAVVAQSSLPEWAKQCLTGHSHVRWAWKARGTGSAKTVREEGWKRFAERLDLARACLTKSWELRPDRPEAATRMIEVVMANAQADDRLRQWLDRAVTAQFDYLPAYTSFLWAMMPRWHGSPDAILDFGRACLATKRFATVVPGVYFNALEHLAIDGDGWQTLYRDPEIAREVMELSQAFVTEPARQSERAVRESFLAINAWMTGNQELAARTFQKLDWKLHPETRGKLAYFNLSAQWMMSESALLGGPLKEDFRYAEDHYDKNYVKKAIEVYDALLKRIGPDERLAYLPRTRLQSLRVEAQLAADDWVTIPLTNTLWHIRKGAWTFAPGGELQIKGDDSTGLILCNVRVGPNFEARFQYEVPEAKCCQGVGLAFDYREHSPKDWWMAAQYRSGSSGPKAQLLEQFFAAGGPIIGIKLQKINQALVQVWEGKVSYFVNATPVLTNHAYRQPLLDEDALLGFGGHKFCTRNTTLIRDFQVRRLRASPPPPPATPTKSTKQPAQRPHD